MTQTCRRCVVANLSGTHMQMSNEFKAASRQPALEWWWSVGVSHPSRPPLPPVPRYLPSLTIGPVCLQTWKPGGGTQAIISLPAAAAHAGAPAADRILERATVRVLISPSLFTAVVFRLLPSNHLRAAVESLAVNIQLKKKKKQAK